MKAPLYVVVNGLGLGGCEHHLSMLLPRLLNDFEVKVISLSAQDLHFAPTLQNLGVTVIVVPKLGLNFMPQCVKRGFGILWRILWLKLFFDKVKKNSLVHSFLPAAYWYTTVAVKLSKAKVYTLMSRRCLNDYFTKYPGIRWVEKYFHKHTDKILANSYAILQQLQNSEGVPLDKLRLIYNGLDLSLYEAIPDKIKLRQEFGITAELLIVNVANLFAYKGHKDLLHALQIFNNKVKITWQCVLIGRDTGILAELKKTVEDLNLQQNIVWLGQRQDVHKWWQIADIGILCSHQEGFANAIIEGMAAAVPMVVTNVGGNSEAIIDGKTGIVVPAKDPKSLAKALEFLCENPKKAQIYGEEARKLAWDRYNIEDCVGKYISCYKEMLTNS